MTMPELTAELRNPIDARLDQIEQILLRVQVSYSERRHIVGDVESQIFELLGRRTENPTRDDVLAVLNSLDPAEAYVPEELRGKLDEPVVLPAPRRPAGPRLSKLAIASTIIAGPVALMGLFLTLTVHRNDADSAALFSGCCLFGASLMGLAALARIVLSAGALRGLGYALFAMLLFPIALANYLIALVLISSNGMVAWAVTVVGVVYLNYLAIRKVSRWLIQRREHVAEAIRHAFAGDKSPKNGVQPI